MLTKAPPRAPPQPHLTSQELRRHYPSAPQYDIQNGRRRKDSVRRPLPRRSECAADRQWHSYPKHVWSPAGGWYAQPANWKANTAIAGAVGASIVAMAWMVSARLEHRDKMPEPGRFFPSR